MPFSENKNQVVRKSNELIEARYKLSIAEQRLVILLASEISPDDEDFKDYEIRVADFAKMFELEKCKSMYAEVQKAAKELLGKRLDLSKNGKEIYTTWLSYVEYVDGSGVVRLRFDKSLKPYLLQLNGYYTQYQLHHVMSFKSQYSMRFYEVLKMDAFKVKNGQFEKKFELQEYRDLLGLEQKSYPVFSDFRKYIVQSVSSEVSDKTDLFINDVKYGKTGRKITNITFLVGIRSEQDTKLRQANLRIEDIVPENIRENHPVIDTLVSIGFSLEVAKKVFNKHTIKKIERNIAFTLAKKQAGLVKDIPAYLNTAIENDYGGAWDIENQKKEEKKLETEKQKQDEIKRKKAEQKKRSDELETVFFRFESLSETERIELLEVFIEEKKSLAGIGKSVVKLYAEMGINVCDNKGFKDAFLIFLEKKFTKENI